MSDLETQMNKVLERIGIPLRAVITPQPNKEKYSEIDLGNHLILIYDAYEDECWNSLLHEIIEFRIRALLNPYRRLVNALIEVVDGEVYVQKERILSEVLHDVKVWRESRVFPAPTNRKREDLPGTTREKINVTKKSR